MLLTADTKRLVIFALIGIICVCIILLGAIFSASSGSGSTTVQAVGETKQSTETACDDDDDDDDDDTDTDDDDDDTDDDEDEAIALDDELNMIQLRLDAIEEADRKMQQALRGGGGATGTSGSPTNLNGTGLPVIHSGASPGMPGSGADKNVGSDLASTFFPRIKARVRIGSPSNPGSRGNAPSASSSNPLKQQLPPAPHNQEPVPANDLGARGSPPEQRGMAPARPPAPHNMVSASPTASIPANVPDARGSAPEQGRRRAPREELGRYYENSLPPQAPQQELPGRNMDAEYQSPPPYAMPPSPYGADEHNLDERPPPMPSPMLPPGMPPGMPPSPYDGDEPDYDEMPPPMLPPGMPSGMPPNISRQWNISPAPTAPPTMAKNRKLTKKAPLLSKIPTLEIDEPPVTSSASSSASSSSSSSSSSCSRSKGSTGSRHFHPGHSHFSHHHHP